MTLLRRLLSSWLAFSEPSRLDVLRAIYRLPVIRPEKPAKPHRNLLVYRQSTKRIMRELGTSAHADQPCFRVHRRGSHS